MTINIFQRIRQNKLLINGSLFSLYSFLQSGISFILLILLAKFISPTEYGSMSLFNTLSTLLGYFVGLNTAGYLSVSFFANNNHKEEFQKDFTIIILTTIVSSIFIFLCIFLFSTSLSNLTNLTQGLIFIALLIALFRTFFQILLNYYRVQEKVISYGIYSCGNSILTALLVFLLVLHYKQSWYGYIYGQLFSLLLFTALSLFLFYKWKILSFKELSIKRFKEIAFWGIPLIPHLGAIWIRQGMDRYIIDHYHTTADVGLFSFALNLTNVIIMVGTSFNNTFSVNIFKTLSSEISLSQKILTLNRQSKKIMTIYVAATILIVLGVIIFIPLIMPNYSPSIKYFLILSFYGLCQCFYSQYCNYFFYFKKTKMLMYITFGSSILHLLLSILITPSSLIFTCFIYVFVQIIIVLLTKKIGLRLVHI